MQKCGGTNKSPINLSVAENKFDIVILYILGKNLTG